MEACWGKSPRVRIRHRGHLLAGDLWGIVLCRRDERSLWVMPEAPGALPIAVRERDLEREEPQR